MAKKKIIEDRVKEAQRLININEDSRQYFFEKADETWLIWLWENGFFDILKKKAEDPKRFSYRTPELGYLVRMTEHNPETVTEIILDIPVSDETLNPEVIDQFLHICGRLPGDQNAKLTGKIKSERWPALMQMYNQWGMDYGKMFESLEKAGYYKEMLELASAVLDLRDDLETKDIDNYLYTTPFCLTNLSYSKVFHYLSKVDGKYVEEAIDITLSILSNLTINFKLDREIASIFTHKDIYPLYDVDIFSIGVRSEYHGSGQDDVREVVALLRTLIERVLRQKCKKKAKLIYEEKYAVLPDSWLIWRIRLYTLCLCPSELMPQLKEALFRIFKTDRYSELIMGAEYKKALKKAFPLMEEDEQSRFVDLAKDFFSHGSDDEEVSLRIRHGERIFSVITGYLTDDQITELINVGFEIDHNYSPAPLIGMGRGGMVKAKGPVTQEEFGNTPISTIVENLTSIWSPAKLIEQDTQRDFLNPLNAEGMGKLIIEDVKTRFEEYLEHSNEFLDRKNLDLHYLYSLISGLTNALDSRTAPLKKASWELVTDLCLRIIQSGNKKSKNHQNYEIDENDTWLGRWNAVYSEMTSLLRKVLGVKGGNLGFEWNSHRSDILSVIEFLFDYPDPKPEDESIDSAKMVMSVRGQEPIVSDPFTLAINSVRGQAFELFVSAVELDTKDHDGSEIIGFSRDIKNLYENLIYKEETRAIMFMIGRYLPTFFFRDKNWLESIMKAIFPKANEKKYLYLAAWEGYLTNNFYLELFEDENFQKLYQNAIVMNEKDYPHQKHFTNPDEGLAHHFALAYVVTDFGFENELFNYFWTDGIIDQHTEFVKKLGRFFISSENPRALKLIKDDENASKKLKAMWEWLLNNYPDSSIFEGIGFWIDLDKGIFNVNDLASYLAKTLGKTNGYLKWDVGLRENIVELAKNSPEDTVEIARLFLLEGGVRKGINSLHFILDEKWIEAFRVLYKRTATKQATLSLINFLIQEGGNYFWPLKEVITGV